VGQSQQTVTVESTAQGLSTEMPRLEPVIDCKKPNQFIFCGKGTGGPSLYLGGGGKTGGGKTGGNFAGGDFGPPGRFCRVPKTPPRFFFFLF